MKNEMMIFNNEQFGQVRVIEIDGEGWLVGKDVAEVLGYTNTSKAIINHVDEEDKVFDMLETESQNGNVSKTKTALINESGLYSLVLRSKLPQAKKFRHWVTSEVLPSIRKHGAYMTEQTLEQALTSPDFLIQLANQLKQEQEARKLAEQQRDELSNEVNTLLVAEDTISFRDFSQIVDIGRTRLFEILRDMEILDKNNIPYQRYSKYFEVINAVKGDKVYPTTRIKPVGQDFLYKRLNLDGYIK